MDINQMYYFITIVESGCNLSTAASRIHISQPALSQFITSFEEREEIALFERKNGRLHALTPIGERIYETALLITDLHNQMHESINSEVARQRGTIKIGIPSLILRVYFSRFFAEIILKSEDYTIEIVEEGSITLRAMLEKNEIDYAILLEPTKLDTQKYEQHIIQIDEMVAFISSDHPLNSVEKLSWNALAEYPFTTFTSTFTTYELLQEKLKQYDIKSEPFMTSSSWDYLVAMTQETEIISVLPRPIEHLLDLREYTVKHFHDYIPFNFFICRKRKKNYTKIESLVYDQVIDYFYRPIDD